MVSKTEIGIIIVLILFSSIVLVISAVRVDACGWYTYEDIEDTRVYYDPYDNIEYIEDGLLKMTRKPTPKEIEKNVYIPEMFHE